MASQAMVIHRPTEVSKAKYIEAQRTQTLSPKRQKSFGPITQYLVPDLKDGKKVIGTYQALKEFDPEKEANLAEL